VQVLLLRRDGLRCANPSSLKPCSTEPFQTRNRSALGGFILGKPVRHLRKGGLVKRSLFRLPRKRFCRSRLGQNLVELGAHLIRVGAIHRRRRVFVELVGLGFPEEIALTRGSHVESMLRRMDPHLGQ
jgi:hypothetical protein